MTAKSSYPRPAWAAVVAGFVMLLSGWAYRALAVQIGTPLRTTAIAPDALDGVPMRIADWVGQDVPLDKAVVRRTDTDTHINRRYTRGLESVSLYVGCGTRTRDLMTHRPEACYVGAGWTRTGRSPRELPLSTGGVLPCVVLEFSRGGLNASKIVVIHYYIVDGDYCQTSSEWRYRFWRIGYVAQVEIVAAVTDSLPLDDVTRIVCGFAADSAPALAGQCAHIEVEKNATSVPEAREGEDP